MNDGCGVVLNTISVTSLRGVCDEAISFDEADCFFSLAMTLFLKTAEVPNSIIEKSSNCFFNTVELQKSS